LIEQTERIDGGWVSIREVLKSASREIREDLKSESQKNSATIFHGKLSEYVCRKVHIFARNSDGESRWYSKLGSSDRLSTYTFGSNEGMKTSAKILQAKLSEICSCRKVHNFARCPARESRWCSKSGSSHRL
jgi:hypothetical protein